MTTAQISLDADQIENLATDLCEFAVKIQNFLLAKDNGELTPDQIEDTLKELNLLTDLYS